MASLNVLMMLAAVPSYFFVLLPIRNFAKYIKEAVVRERCLSFNFFTKNSRNISNFCWTLKQICLAIFCRVLTLFKATERNNIAITVTLNILLKANLCISIFDTRHTKPSEKICLFSSKSFTMFFGLVCYVMQRTARAQHSIYCMAKSVSVLWLVKLRSITYCSSKSFYLEKKMVKKIIRCL